MIWDRGFNPLGRRDSGAPGAHEQRLAYLFVASLGGCELAANVEPVWKCERGGRPEARSADPPLANSSPVADAHLYNRGRHDAGLQMVGEWARGVSGTPRTCSVSRARGSEASGL